MVDDASFEFALAYSRTNRSRTVDRRPVEKSTSVAAREGAPKRLSTEVLSSASFSRLARALERRLSRVAGAANEGVFGDVDESSCAYRFRTAPKWIVVARRVSSRLDTRLALSCGSSGSWLMLRRKREVVVTGVVNPEVFDDVSSPLTGRCVS